MRAEGQWDRIGADFERRTKPAQVQKIRANNRMAVLAWADAVQRGNMTRAAFDQNAEQVLRMGHLLPADYEEARAEASTADQRRSLSLARPRKSRSAGLQVRSRCRLPVR